ncbi:MAG TPA: hypothetical protein VMW17_22240 [Candidatus Binatia bacterium]|nr:hypothetical protein [Candidatus Binatia bacterium]
MAATDTELTIEGGERLSTPLRVLLLVEVACAILFVAQQALPLWNDRWVQDDAYISFRYAKHFVQGHGLVYNIGQHVEGYTNFLWTIISAIPMAAGAVDPLPFMQVFSLALWLLSYALLLLLGIRLFREGVWIGPLALIPLTYHWSFNMWFFSGMETPLVSFLTIAVVYCFSLDPERHPWALFLASLSAVGLTMTRPDGVVTMAALAVAGVLLYWRPLLHERRWRTYLVMPALPIVLVYIPFNLWRVLYYGSFYPNTYYAKVAYLTYYSRGWEYLTTYLSTYSLGPVLLLPVIGACVAQTPTARRFLCSATLAAVFVFFYVVRLGGDFMEWRFVTPVSGVLYPAIVVGAAACAHALRRLIPASVPMVGWVVGTCAVASLTIMTAQATSQAKNNAGPGGETIALLRRYCDPHQLNWKATALLFEDILPKNIKIATTSAGIIPFYFDRPCLDLHGLTDPDIAHMPVDPNNRGRTGHEHWLQDFNVMRARGVDVYLYWVDPRGLPLSLLTPAQPDLEMVSARLSETQFVQFLILNHKALDMDQLRKDKRLVFYGDKSVSPRPEFYAVRDQFANYAVVDRLDLEEDASQSEHGFEEHFERTGRPSHNYHEKMLFYRPPIRDVFLHDNGRRISDEARWTVRNVSTHADLVMIVRYDHTGGADYSVTVNGREVAGRLHFAGGEEVWDDAWITIPAALLTDGANEIRISRDLQSPTDSELYYMWFAQPPSAASAPASGEGTAKEAPHA